MTARDHKGRFASCPIKRAKMAVTGWWYKYGDNVSALTFVILCVFIAITGFVWLFGDKVTTECHEGYSIRYNYSHVVTYQVYSETYNGVVDKGSHLGAAMEPYVDSCAWGEEVRSHYTLVEVLGIEWSAVVSGAESLRDWMADRKVV
jgi:hypothetical protein